MSLRDHYMYPEVAQREADDLIERHFVGDGYFEGGVRTQSQGTMVLTDLVSRGIVTHVQVHTLMDTWLKENRR
jgi:hypothetical protein